jgi:hypothetical protein
MERTTSLPLPSPSTPGQGWAAQGARNPVSARLYKVLGARYDDDATRAALRTLSDFYAPAPTPAVPAAHERDAWDESDSEDDAMRPAPATPALAFLRDRPAGDAAKRARTHMRRDVERRLADGSRRFLAAFGDVDDVRIHPPMRAWPWLTRALQKLDELQAQIGAMKASCADAEAQLAHTNDACRDLLERAGSLREQRRGDPRPTHVCVLIPYQDGGRPQASARRRLPRTLHTH